MADTKDPLDGAGKSLVSRLENTNFSGVHRHVPLRFATAAGVILFDPEGFIADVFNSVNDLILSGFDSLEEYFAQTLNCVMNSALVQVFTLRFAAETLNVQSEEARCALRNGVDKIYNKVQDNVDEHLSRWESICRAHYFSMKSDPRTLTNSDNEAVVARDSVGDAGIGELQEQEEMLDKELCSLRSQLITAERDSSCRRRELTLLERELALRSEFIGDKRNPGHFDGGILEEVMKSAILLKKKMEKVSSLERQRCRHPSASTVLSGSVLPVPETKFSRGSKGVEQLFPKVTDITADPRFLELVSTQRLNDGPRVMETASAMVHVRRSKAAGIGPPQ